jgi:hypothetical protein
MNHETAVKLSRALTEAAIAHTIQVGYHAELNPPVQCRVDLAMPRRYDGGVSEALKEIEAIGEEFGLVLATAMMGDGLTFSTPTPAELLRQREVT